MHVLARLARQDVERGGGAVARRDDCLAALGPDAAPDHVHPVDRGTAVAVDHDALLRLLHAEAARQDRIPALGEDEIRGGNRRPVLQDDREAVSRSVDLGHPGVADHPTKSHDLLATDRLQIRAEDLLDAQVIDEIGVMHRRLVLPKHRHRVIVLGEEERCAQPPGPIPDDDRAHTDTSQGDATSVEGTAPNRHATALEPAFRLRPALGTLPP